MTVRIWPTLPKDAESNGLHLIERQLVDDPDGKHFAVIMIDQKRVTTDNDEGETIPTARILHIEPITKPHAVDQARRLLVEAHSWLIEQIQGKPYLPALRRGQ